MRNRLIWPFPPLIFPLVLLLQKKKKKKKKHDEQKEKEIPLLQCVWLMLYLWNKNQDFVIPNKQTTLKHSKNKDNNNNNKIILLIVKTIPKKSRMSSFSRIRSIERTLTCFLKTDLFYRNMRVKVLASPQQIKKKVSRLRFSSCELHHSVLLKF